MAKQVPYDSLERGDVWSVQSDGDRLVCRADIAFQDDRVVYLHGKAIEVAIPGIDPLHTPFLFEGILYVGCSRCSVTDALRALAEASAREQLG